MEHYIEGKTIIVTGGSCGFGLEATRMLLEMGGNLVIAWRNPDKLREAELALAGVGDLLAVKADATSTEDWRRLMDATLKRYPTLDVLVNNHGAGGKIAPI